MIEHAIKRFNVKSNIILADSANVLTSFYKYKFWKIPKINNGNLKKILIGLKKRKINVVIPTSDIELSFWSSNKDFFKKKNIFVMVSDFKTTKLCLDKLNFYKHLLKHKILTPHTSIISPPIKKDYLVKERFIF